MRMDRYAAMHCFCRVVETGSFAAAARELDCARSVVTKHVQSLEDWTGARLLARTTRSMQLTEAGAKFHAFCRRVLEDADITLGELRSDTAGVQGRIVVSCPVSLGLTLLAPHLHAFQERHPEVALEVRLNDHVVDLVREGVDIAFRGKARLDDSSLVAVPLIDLPRVLCASPAFLRSHGTPAHPSDLERLPCLAYLLGDDALRWTLVGEEGPKSVQVRGMFKADNSLMLIDAMRRGAGIGLVPEVMVREDLGRGWLAPILPEWRALPRRLFAVYPSRDHLPARLRALVTFIKQQLLAQQP